ncbi:hypothetical protein STEG23_016977, partial [Scotinomys teguina]
SDVITQLLLQHHACLPDAIFFTIVDCSLKIREPDVLASWFLDPGGWSKTTVVSLYFVFPGICTLSLDNGNTHLPEVIRPWISRCLQQKERIYWYQSIQESYYATLAVSELAMQNRQTGLEFRDFHLFLYPEC